MSQASAGDAVAQYNLGNAYHRGDGVEQDYSVAREWYEKAAEKGNVIAAESLAIFYDFGYGCSKDPVNAVKWYRIAAERGLQLAQNNLGVMYQKGLGIEKDYKQAFYWYKKSAEQGAEYAEYNTGICYLEGKGVKESKKEAYFWLKKSAEHNYDKAKQRLQQMVDSGYDPNKDKPIFCNDIISKNPFRVLGVYINSSARDVQASKTKINAFLRIGSIPDFPSDHLMMEETCPTLYNDDNDPIFVLRDEESVNSALAAINMPLDKVGYALFWFANVTAIDELALNNISDNIDIEEANLLWNKIENFSSFLNKGLMSLCVGDIESAIENYTLLIHNESYRNEFLKVVDGENFTISEEELSHIFIDSLFDYFPNEDWKTAFESNCGNYDDIAYITAKLISGPTKVIETAISTAANVNANSALLSYNASLKLRNTTKDALSDLNELMDTNSIQYQMIVDKLANQILQCAINYFNHSDDDDAPFKALELQKYAQDIAVGKITKDRCTQNVSILQGIIDKLPPAPIRHAIKSIHAILKEYSQKAKSPEPDSTPHSKLLALFGGPTTNAATMMERLVEHIVLIREKMGPNSKEYQRIATEISAVALGIAIDNVNESPKGFYLDGSLLNSSAIRDALKDAVKTVKYIELIGPEQKFLNERLAPNKKTLDKMAESYAVSADVDNRIFLTECEYYNSCHSKLDLTAYLKKYPEGSFIEEAKRKIFEIESLETQLANVTNVDACLEIFKNRYRDEACDALIDDKCFSLVKTNENDCRKYLRTFSNHSEEIKTKLKTILRWWWALGIVDLTLLGCVLFPGTIYIPIVIGFICLATLIVITNF